MYCGKCGKEIKDTALVCPYCGSEVGNKSTVEPKKDRKFKSFGILGFIVVVAVLVILGKRYIDGKIENRIIGDWYVIDRNDIGELIPNEDGHYAFYEDGTFRTDDGEGEYMIQDNEITLYDMMGNSVTAEIMDENSAIVLDGTMLTSLEKEELDTEYDDVMVWEAEGNTSVWVKME